MEPDLSLLHPQPVIDDEEDRRKRPVRQLVEEDVDDPTTPSRRLDTDPDTGVTDVTGFEVAMEPIGSDDGG